MFHYCKIASTSDCDYVNHQVRKGVPMDDKDEENDLLAYTSDNEEDVEGYESENEIVNLQWFYKENEEVLSGRSVVFSSDRINLPIRKLFHNALVFDTQSRPWCKGIVLTYA
ncbi:hypothetical protein WN944_018712 [Citrus x changshan-huyou]|uniref:Uncharacterized protein n=1 Tax=Citrus x changshan-huyou TaxID=2935761 RepID=A0AAP0LU57_9ROSI